MRQVHIDAIKGIFIKFLTNKRNIEQKNNPGRLVEQMMEQYFTIGSLMTFCTFPDGEQGWIPKRVYDILGGTKGFNSFKDYQEFDKLLKSIMTNDFKNSPDYSSLFKKLEQCHQLQRMHIACIKELFEEYTENRVLAQEKLNKLLEEAIQYLFCGSRTEQSSMLRDKTPTTEIIRLARLGIGTSEFDSNNDYYQFLDNLKDFMQDHFMQCSTETELLESLEQDFGFYRKSSTEPKLQPDPQNNNSLTRGETANERDRKDNKSNSNIEKHSFNSSFSLAQSFFGKREDEIEETVRFRSDGSVENFIQS